MAKLIVDTMGGDLGSKIVVSAIKEFLKENTDSEIIAVGKKEELSELENIRGFNYLDAETLEKIKTYVTSVSKKHNVKGVVDNKIELLEYWGDINFNIIALFYIAYFYSVQKFFRIFYLLQGNKRNIYIWYNRWIAWDYRYHSRHIQAQRRLCVNHSGIQQGDGEGKYLRRQGFHSQDW